ncbi:two-component system, OmpR family, sensor histidine kinase GraS [Staphylococcus epidermidis]|uniref:histidine kinase GraS/ApsS n=1 Tax=Staphylococcus epidermidis TaxID=1282 RepID=UPI00026C20D7|nr:histidine kinase GraS/ApsS [Staphylococcus epidermidis]EJE02469.1 sensor histidine kinase GraS [Staphylococcus epidermidis NIHLM040]EKS40514.1 sensor histidine kinase gRas [Staphylococcus epidermidis BVS058A4]KAB2280939.1 HAMP domain-containing histidine kinase [Staphylococcus epidermidis]KTF26106.1 histidine kinase [Staphylococcus epidermidis FS1]MBC2965910.1 sensor histidine kinase [Staphylococcus epidermidis]
MNNFRWFWFFIKSRSNWILWILFLNIILLGVAYIDYEISVESVFYIVILNLGLSILFLLFTFVKEVRLSKHFYEDKEIEEIKHKDLAETPFQQQVIDYLYRHITAQKEKVVEQQLQIKNHEQTITEFVHDIKTPVTAMKLLIDQENDDQRKRALLFEWSRINEMLDKQLYLTRLETQHRDMYFDYISLKRMVIDEIQVTRHISQAKGIGFELDFKDEQKVYTDVKWCRMMIRQVLSNSLKYSDNSTINLSGYNIEGHVVLKIKDYGRGISKRDLPRIFDRGFTSTTDRNDTASSGMGLYLVQSVKEQLGIEVKVDSIVGKGTTFYFIFPQQNEILERMSKVTRLSF